MLIGDRTGGLIGGNFGGKSGRQVNHINTVTTSGTSLIVREVDYSWYVDTDEDKGKKGSRRSNVGGDAKQDCVTGHRMQVAVKSAGRLTKALAPLRLYLLLVRGRFPLIDVSDSEATSIAIDFHPIIHGLSLVQAHFILHHQKLAPCW